MALMFKYVSEGEVKAFLIYMKDKTKSSIHAEQDMIRVLQAERDAEYSIQNCENNSRQIISDAQDKARQIDIRADQRISITVMRHSHKLNHVISEIEKSGEAALSQEANRHYDMQKVRLAIEKLAVELCNGSVASNVIPGKEEGL